MTKSSHSELETSYSELIANHIHDYRQIPQANSVYDSAVELIVDTVGVTFAGFRQSDKPAMQELAALGMAQTAPFSLDAEFDPRATGFTSSYYAHLLDFDDTYRLGSVHIGCVAVPTAFAMAVYCDSTLEDFLRSVVLAVETTARISEAVHEAQHKIGFHLTGTANVFGAAASAAFLLRLPVEAIVDSFGLAGDRAAGFRQYHFDPCATKALHAAHASQIGIEATLMAKAGFRGPKRILEGEFGFCNVLTNRQYDSLPLSSFMGRRLRIEDISYKPWPSGRGTHSAIEATLALCREKNITANEIREIVVETHERALINLNKPYPENENQCQLSIQYCVACAALFGRVTIDLFWGVSAEIRKQIMTFATCISLVENSEINSQFKGTDKTPVIVRIMTTDGIKLSKRVDYPLGCPQNPLGFTALIDKFMANMELSASNGKTISFIEELRTSERQTKVKTLFSKLLPI
jgi:2-methylcitrate dehydratase PrpD